MFQGLFLLDAFANLVCPFSSGEDVKQKVISTQNVERFLDRLILNKEFLVTELESL